MIICTGTKLIWEDYEMNIIVVGCGKIGSAIISELTDEGHDVTAIDSSDVVLGDITNIYDVMSVCGNGADCDTLEEARADKADMFIAVTDSDELNMLSCFLAQKMGAQHTIARIRNPEYNDRSLGFMKQHLGLSLAINPELLVAQEIYNILKFPSAVKLEYFSRRNFEMVEVKLGENSDLDGIRINKMREKYKANYLVGAVRRGEDVYIPDGNFELKCGDRLGITAAPSEIHKLLKQLGILKKQVKNVMILGGGKTTYYLSKMLCNVGIDTKIVEIDERRCEVLGTLVPKAIIIYGDGTKQELLIEEGLMEQDAFVSLTGMDEQNILMSIFANTKTVKKVISKVNKDELSALSEQIGLDSIVSPKEVTSSIILRYARALENTKDSNVEALYRLMDGRVEALEFIVNEKSPVTGITFKELSLKSNILIAGIIRNRKTIIPTGDDMIMVGDRVVVLAAGHYLHGISDILK